MQNKSLQESLSLRQILSFNQFLEWNDVGRSTDKPTGLLSRILKLLKNMRQIFPTFIIIFF